MQRTVLITGCSSGIGLAAARTLRTRGWRVLATARNPADLARLSEGDGLDVVPLELADPASIAACAARTLELTDGKLDALYNNAAYGVIGAMEDVSAQALRHHLEVNVVGTHDLTRRFIPAMRARGKGRIVMCSSVLGFVSGPFRGAYCASKFALEAISDALRIELAPARISVSIIEPGPIESNFAATAAATFKANIDMQASVHRSYYERRLAEIQAGSHRRVKQGPDAVVAKLIHALESPRPRARYRVGLPTHAAALARRVLPDKLLDLVIARI